MFRRKDKAVAHSISQRHNAPPQASAAASSAATLAFLNNQKPSTSLAAAAAGAALKQNPHPPTNVGNVQTKRLIRRDSNGSSATGSPRPGLERRTSLTDRQLRSPSPGREQVVRSPANAPPVPPMPQGVERTPSGRHRAASVEAQRRLSSPPPKQSGGRGMSLDRAPRNVSTPVSAQKKAPPKLANLNESTETPQRSSVNFSRPMSPAPQSPVSPTAPSSGQAGTGWFAAPVTSDAEPRQTLESLEPKTAVLPAAEASGIQSGLQGVADQPVKKKKKRKKASAGGNEGARLSEGTMHLTGTAVEPTRAALAGEPSSPTHARSSFDSDRSTDIGEHSEQAKTRMGAMLLNRQPSLIDEAPELEQSQARANTGRKVDSTKPSSDVSRAAAVRTPEPVLAQPASTVPDYGSAANNPPVARTTSLSPSRSARFKAKPVEYLGATHHQPLGRAASPAKSALKHSPSSSVRTASPEHRFSAPSSEVGFGDSLTKKKSNRVSFDETPTVHTGLQNSKYADTTPTQPIDFANDLEDIMKPRAALPTFGSVRNRKEDRLPTSSMAASKHSSTQPSGHATDTIVGGILAQDFAGKSAAPAHDMSMPLAPEVTSVEGTGYASDSESNYSENHSIKDTPQEEAPQAVAKEPETIAEAVESFQTHDQITSERQNGAVGKAAEEPRSQNMDDSTYGSQILEAPPTIAVQPATPAAEEEKKDLHIPGSFPGGWDDEEAQPAPAITKNVTPVAILPADTNRTNHGTLAALRAEESDTESDTSSIWSDAEEDFPSGPGGFASLDAMVDSDKTKAGPPAGLVLSKHAPSAAEGAPPSPVAAQWDEATAYWRGLSEQRKRELEQAALRKEQGLAEESSEGETDDSSEEEEEVEQTPVLQPARPATPPQKLQKKRQPKLESPIAFAKTSQPPVAAPRTSKELKLRSSMRQSHESEDEAPAVRMKKSMRASQDSTRPASRTSGEHHFRSSMRGAQPVRPDPVRRHSSGLDESRYAQPAPKAATVVQNGRPRGASNPAPAPKSALKKGTAQPAPAAPTLRRKDSDDSVSSFRRQRVASPGRMSMRSMRGAPQAQSQPAVEQRPQSPPDKKTRGLLSRMRSLSPTGREPAPQMRGSTRPESSSGPAPRMQTMRTSQPAAEPKSPKASRFKSPTRLGFGRKSKAAPESPVSPPRQTAPVAAPAVSPPKYKSRLSADSDSEDEAPRAKFVSRFADSDDDEPDSPQSRKQLAPVRGIPRKRGENDDDSTDLEDSGDERAKQVPPVPTLRDVDYAHGKKAPLTNGNTRPASILSAGSLRKGKTGSEKKGLDSSRFAQIPPVPPAQPIQAPSTPTERPQQKRRLSWLGMGKSKERSSSMPPPSLSSPPSSPLASNKPNLLRRSTPTGLPTLSEDWPLASPIGEDTRPSTADGPGTALRAGSLRNRPDVGKRRSTADYPARRDEGSVMGDGESTVGGGRKRVGFNFESGEPVYSERTGKKKKFGTLRKMFGLHD